MLSSVRPGQRTLRNLSALYAVDSLLQNRPEADVLHAHFGTIANAFLLGPALLHAPLLVTFHGGDHNSAIQARGPNLYRQLFRTADGVTVNSEHARAVLEGLGCPPERIHKVPIGIDLASFSFSARELGDHAPARLLTVARLVENKGVAYALRAVEKVTAQHPNLRYEIIGDGPLGNDLKRLSRELGLEDVVTFHGRRDNDFVRERMAECHLFLLPSVTAADGAREGTPVSLLEAQARGMPVLSTLLTGIPEIVVDGVTGFLVQERDVDALADRLGVLLRHPERWPEIGRAGRENVERHHDIDEITEGLIALYRELIADRRMAAGSERSPLIRSGRAADG